MEEVAMRLEGTFLNVNILNSHSTQPSDLLSTRHQQHMSLEYYLQFLILELLTACFHLAGFLLRRHHPPREST